MSTLATPLETPPASAADATSTPWFNEPTVVPPAEPPAEPAAAPSGPFLRVNERTVYNTPEDAMRGFAEKERYIADLQAQAEHFQRLLAGGPPSAVPPPPTAIDVLSTAIRPGGDPRTFDQYLDQRLNQAWQERLSAFTPIISYSNAARAKAEAAQYDPNIPAFVDSPAFSRILQDPAFTTLKEAIDAMLVHPQGAQHLPRLYAYAYWGARAKTPAAPVRPTPPASTTPPQTLPSGGEKWAANDPRWDLPLASFTGWGPSGGK